MPKGLLSVPKYLKGEIIGSFFNRVELLIRRIKEDDFVRSIVGHGRYPIWIEFPADTIPCTFG